jgi:ETC complex I subunit conserved region
MAVRIYKPARTAMQSGRARTRHWVVEFEPNAPSTPDPLMGWTSTSDTEPQVRLRFDSLDRAIGYAVAHGLDYELEMPHARAAKSISYAANFASDRKTPFTH